MAETTAPRVFGKCKTVLVLNCIVWGFFALICFAGAFSWASNEADSTATGILFIIGLCLLIPIAQAFANKLILEDDHVTIKSGLIFKKKEQIKYKKINNVEQSSAFGFGGIKIFTGNDKPTEFKYLDQYETVVELINDKIDNMDK